MVHVQRFSAASPAESLGITTILKRPRKRPRKRTVRCYFFGRFSQPESPARVAAWELDPGQYVCSRLDNRVKKCFAYRRSSKYPALRQPETGYVSGTHMHVLYPIRVPKLMNHNLTIALFFLSFFFSSSSSPRIFSGRGRTFFRSN
jgi:hypothetical protein